MKIEHLTLLAFTSIATGMDLSGNKVSNWLVGTGCLSALLLSVLQRSFAGLPDRLLGILLPVFCLFGLFAIGGIGGGDIKLLSMIGAFLGWRAAGKCLLFAGLLAAVYALCSLCCLHLLGKQLWYVLQYVHHSLLSHSLQCYEAPEKRGMHCTVPVLLALWMILEGWI